MYGCVCVDSCIQLFLCCVKCTTNIWESIKYSYITLYPAIFWCESRLCKYSVYEGLIGDDCIMAIASLNSFKKDNEVQSNFEGDIMNNREGGSNVGL